MKLHLVAYLFISFSGYGQIQDHFRKDSANSKADSAQKLVKPMSDYSPTFEKAHPDAKAIMNEDFYFNPIDETGPFGNDDGADTYAGFKDWRHIHLKDNPKTFLLEQIDYWDYPKFDIYETDIKKLHPYLKREKLGNRYMSGIDAAIIAIAFGQLYLEGVIDKDFKELAKISIQRQLIPDLLALWGDPYKIEREAKLRKMLAALSK